MDQTQKQALQVTKEIVVKFIETNRISPNTFPELFGDIYRSVLGTIRDEPEADTPKGDEAGEAK
jgi:predicted transcriptional regulator